VDARGVVPVDPAEGGEFGRQDEFALGGGAALIAYGIIDRATRDLDFLGPAGTVVDAFVRQVERHLHTLSFSTERDFEYPQLVRLKVSFGGEDLSIDIGVDYRSFPVVDTDEGLLMHERDLAGDKVLAFCRRQRQRRLGRDEFHGKGQSGTLPGLAHRRRVRPQPGRMSSRRFRTRSNCDARTGGSVP